MKIIKATLDDVSNLAAMNRRLIEDERHSNPMDVGQLADRMQQWLTAEYTSYIAKDADEVLGYCLYRDDGEFYYLRQLFVERQHRRSGIATEFLDWMYHHIWQDKHVRLEVLSHNTEAIAFYEKYGFAVTCLGMEK